MSHVAMQWEYSSALAAHVAASPLSLSAPCLDTFVGCAAVSAPGQQPPHAKAVDDVLRL
jgi:hypothetical protein